MPQENRLLTMKATALQGISRSIQGQDSRVLDHNSKQEAGVDTKT